MDERFVSPDKIWIIGHRRQEMPFKLLGPVHTNLLAIAMEKKWVEYHP